MLSPSFIKAHGRIAFMAAALGVALTMAVVVPASAQELSRYGGRVGFSASPDQITLGGYLAFDEVSPNVRPRPSIDLGFGNSLTTVIINADLEYIVLTTSFAAVPFVGAGLGFAYSSFDVPDIPGFDIDSSSWDVGLNIYGGIEKELSGYKTVAVELRLGIFDLPDLKITGSFGFF